ncbi:MAG TPA: cupin-like domain-containing protein, partial [Thermomonas sp.]|nr:cupin-like domain-containing protein [Thermomonas sp.]
IEQTIRERGWGDKALFPRCYVFISAPNSITPFHFDRASNFLLQIRGSKQVSVFKPWDDRVISPVEYERRGADEPTAVRWKPESAAFGTTYTCGPGDALHIPFAAGHHVRNGPDDLSVTLSIFFNHRRSRDQLQALRFNNRMRKLLAPWGMTPARVGQVDALDACKSLINRSMDRLKGVAMAPLTGSLPFLHEAMGVADLFPRVMA